jgi:hypothetical protein
MGAVVPFKPACDEEKNTCSSISINSQEEGVSVRFTKIKGKYYICVRDLIIGVCLNDPKKDKKAWIAACKYASNTWLYLSAKLQKDELAEYLGNFHFPGNHILMQLSLVYYNDLIYSILVL